MLEQVSTFIQENVYHSRLYDNATDIQRKKAVNQAVNTLFRHLPDVYKDRDALPVEDVAEQVLWIMKLDDSFQRAEMGATMITVDGVSVMLREMDRTISPVVLNAYGIRDTRKRKVGSYSDAMGYRTGMGRYPWYLRGR